MLSNNTNGVVRPQETILNSNNDELLGVVRQIINDTQDVVDDSTNAQLHAELNERVIKTAEKQDRIESLERSLEELEKKQEVLDKNDSFLRKNEDILTGVAGVLGMSSYDSLVNTSDNGIVSLTAKFYTARARAASVVESKIKSVDLEELSKDINFKQLVGLYYLQARDLRDSSRRSTNQLLTEIERALYAIVKQRVRSEDLNQIFLGELQYCN